MTDRSGGQVLVQGLRNYGVDTAYCVPGESFLAALDAFYEEEEDIRLITCRQEGGATFMAEAYGKLTGNPGICFVTRGPGASNAMVGIHTALQDSTPLLLFVGQVARSDLGREAFQELDYKEVYGGVAKTVFDINDANDIPEILESAWIAALSDRPGPVVISLPEDMLTDRVSVEDRPRPVIHYHSPTDSAVSEFQNRLLNSRQPVLLSGGAGWTPGASQLLREFSEKHNVPVVTAFRRQDTFDNHHANYIGELGLKPNPDLVKYVQDADLFIALGPRIGDITTSGYTIFNVPEFDGDNPDKLVHIFPDKNELNSVYKTTLGIHAHPELFLAAVSEIPARNVQSDSDLQVMRKSYLDFVDLPRNVGSDVRMDLVTAKLRELLPSDAIITNGAGLCSAWAQRNMQFSTYPSQLAPTNGTMGYGAPAAIAAKLEHPARTVVSFNGDGCFLMNGQELATAVQYKAGVIFLVIDNSSYGTIRAHQEQHYPGRRVATDLQNPDFATLARAYGAHGATVTETQDFETAFLEILEKTQNTSLPGLIHIVTDY